MLSLKSSMKTQTSDFKNHKEQQTSVLKRYYKTQILKQDKLLKTITWILRIGVFGTFLGHGINAILIKPNWIPLITAFGFTDHFAKQAMPLIGVLDIVVALCSILYPKPIVFAWAFLWAFLTALSRPISGEPLIEFIERASNWAIPLVIYLILSQEKRMLLHQKKLLKTKNEVII